MTTGKTVLLAGGVALAGYVVYRMLKPSPSLLGKGSSATGNTGFGVLTNGLASLTSSFFSSGSKATNGPSLFGSAAAGQSSFYDYNTTDADITGLQSNGLSQSDADALRDLNSTNDALSLDGLFS